MYIDMLFIENFIIDYFLLNITSKFSKIKTTRIRLILGATIGALYIIVMLFPSLKIFLNIAMKIAVSILMIIVVFAPEKFKDFFKVLAMFYIISFAIGGAAFALFYFTGKGNVINGVFLISDYPLSLLLTAFVFGYLLFKFTWCFIQNKILTDELIYNVMIIIENKKIEINAILDTGNSLKDPVSNSPVIVVEYDAIKNILPSNFSNVFNSKEQNINFEQLYSSIGSSSMILRIRLIPFSSLGRQNGMLVGIKPDFVRLNNKKNDREIKDVIIGIYNYKISKNGEYSALLYPEILK